LAVIALDRFTKHLVRTRPALQHWDVIPGWLNFQYTLNPGMAMGMRSIYIPVFNVSIPISTVEVSVISMLATIGIIGYVFYTMSRARLGYLFLMGMIVGGAIGNIIDRFIMAKIGGYGGILDGHVVDFIHFIPKIHGYPVFPYVFNVADASITTAIIALLIFNKQILPQRKDEEDETSENKAISPGDMLSEDELKNESESQ